MALTKYRRPQHTLASPFNGLMHEFLGRDIGQFLGSDDIKPTLGRVNIVEREHGLELQMLAPGFTKEDLKLRVEDDVLTISAERKNEELKENERYTRREFTRSAFTRSFHLPETVQVDAIKATFTNGILHLDLPKAEEQKPKAKEIAIS